MEPYREPDIFSPQRGQKFVELVHRMARAILHFHTKVVGVTYNNIDGSRRQSHIRSCEPDQWLVLVREPDNVFDAEAIMVCTRDGAQLGYLSQECSDELAPLIDGGTNLWAQIANLTGGTASKPTRGVNVAIYELLDEETAPPASQRNPVADLQGGPIAAYVSQIEGTFVDGFVSPEEISDCRRFAKAYLTVGQLKAAHARVFSNALSCIAGDEIVTPAEEKRLDGIRKVLSVLGWAP